MMNLEERVFLTHALSALSPSERTVVLGIYSLKMKQVDIARHIGYSTRHVRRLHRRALITLKQTLADS